MYLTAICRLIPNGPLLLNQINRGKLDVYGQRFMVSGRAMQEICFSLYFHLATNWHSDQGYLTVFNMCSMPFSFFIKNYI